MGAGLELFLYKCSYDLLHFLIVLVCVLYIAVLAHMISVPVTALYLKYMPTNFVNARALKLHIATVGTDLIAVFMYTCS